MIKKINTLLLLSIALIGVCSAQERRVDQPIPDELYATVQKRAEVIQEELASLQAHDWAGVYLQGDHHPTMFWISPQNGFLVTSSLHTFSPSWVNFGKVEYSNGRIRIYPELPKGDKSAHIMPTEYIVVKWDGYRHLVRPDELINFAYDVHSRSGSASVDYFTRGTEADPKGLPDLPKEYLKYFRMKPIVARVVSINEVDDQMWNNTFVIDSGAKKGVIKGMTFFLTGQKFVTARLWVTKVFENRAECRLAGIGQSANFDQEVTLKPGFRFSSRMPKEQF